MSLNIANQEEKVQRYTDENTLISHNLSDLHRWLQLES